MNRHRLATYSVRREILHDGDISTRIKKLIRDEVTALATSPEATSEKFDAMISEVFPLDEQTLDKLFDQPATKFAAALEKAAMTLYKEQEERFSEEVMRKVERDVYLQVMDNLWIRHLENMDHLREGIHWISVGQRDPLVEYRRQSQSIFEEMQNTLRHETLRSLFHARPVESTELAEPTETELTLAARKSVSNADEVVAAEHFEETDFTPLKKELAAKKIEEQKRKKNRKKERQNKKKAKRR
jgi:preprotein translocase subunit SecA